MLRVSMEDEHIENLTCEVCNNNKIVDESEESHEQKEGALALA
jgi:peptide deformylase